MKVYIDEKDIGTTITYKEENGKKEYIYCHDREGFVFKDISDYTKQVKNEVCEEIGRKMGEKLVRMQPDGEFGTRLAIGWYEINKVLDQIQGDR